MNRYIFDSHYGRCSLADTETGLVVQWNMGDFNNTRSHYIEGILVVPEGRDKDDFIKEILLQMGAYIAMNYEKFL